MWDPHVPYFFLSCIKIKGNISAQNFKPRQWVIQRIYETRRRNSLEHQCSRIPIETTCVWNAVSKN